MNSFKPFIESIGADTVIFYEFENMDVKIVLKNKNPPNLPQARPIEQFWSICKNLLEYISWFKSSFYDIMILSVLSIL